MNELIEQIGRERLEEFIRQPLANGLTRSEIMTMARALLAVMGAQEKPAGTVTAYTINGVVVNRCKLSIGDKVYTTPPAASVPDGWVKCSERMPPVKTAIIAGKWNGRLWATKWATYIPSHPEANSFGYIMPGGSWEPDFWMSLPEAPALGGE